MIYIVEDDANILELETYALNSSGYEVTGFSEAKPIYEAINNEIPQLIILDIMLPGEDGLHVLQKLRKDKKTQEVPIILVTAKDSELDKVKGLDMGADDYIAKPFGIMELVSRVRALLRRTTKTEETNLDFESIKIYDEEHRVLVNDNVVELTYKEYELLKCLVANAEIVLSREKLMNKVWGFDFEGETRTVDMHIKTLRKKLGDAGNYIKTVRNVGYKIGRN